MANIRKKMWLIRKDRKKAPNVWCVAVTSAWVPSIAARLSAGRLRLLASFTRVLRSTIFESASLWNEN